jgi:hypothetical protein
VGLIRTLVRKFVGEFCTLSPLFYSFSTRARACNTPLITSPRMTYHRGLEGLLILRRTSQEPICSTGM